MPEYKSQNPHKKKTVKKEDPAPRKKQKEFDHVDVVSAYSSQGQSRIAEMKAKKAKKEKIATIALAVVFGGLLVFFLVFFLLHSF